LEQPAKIRAPRIGPALAAVLLLALAAVYAVPRAIDAFYGLDDPSRVASRALDDTFDAAVAGRAIEAALAANDADLAQSFVDLAAARNVVIDPALQEKVTSATAEAATTRHKAKSFARGFITGEPDDMAALAGTAVGAIGQLAAGVFLIVVPVAWVAGLLGIAVRDYLSRPRTRDLRESSGPALWAGLYALPVLLISTWTVAVLWWLVVVYIEKERRARIVRERSASHARS